MEIHGLLKLSMNWMSQRATQRNVRISCRFGRDSAMLTIF